VAGNGNPVIELARLDGARKWVNAAFRYSRRHVWTKKSGKGFCCRGESGEGGEGRLHRSFKNESGGSNLKDTGGKFY